jgi:nucleoside-diphosphate-sugar epimerase
MNGSATLLTGGTGFLGSHLLRALVAAGEQVVVLKRSTSAMTRLGDLAGAFGTWDLDAGDVEEVFHRHPITRVIHCATNYGRNETAPWETIEANLVLPLKLIHLARRAKTKMFVNTDTILNKRLSHYSLSKSQFTEWLRSYAGDLVCLNIALEHFYGADDDPSKFVSGMLQALQEERPLLALTPGEQRRDFIHVDDVISGFTCLLAALKDSPCGFFHYEIGSGHSTSIREFMALAKDLTGNQHTELAFGALPYRHDEVMNSAVDTSALRALGWHPRVGLREGLLRVLAEPGDKEKRCAI